MNTTKTSIHNKTHDLSSVFLHCGAKTDKVSYDSFQKCKMETRAIQNGKTVNYHCVCYNFKHPKFSQSKLRQRRLIYHFWLHHHSSFSISFIFHIRKQLSKCEKFQFA